MSFFGSLNSSSSCGVIFGTSDSNLFPSVFVSDCLQISILSTLPYCPSIRSVPLIYQGERGKIFRSPLPQLIFWGNFNFLFWHSKVIPYNTKNTKRYQKPGKFPSLPHGTRLLPILFFACLVTCTIGRPNMHLVP